MVNVLLISVFFLTASLTGVCLQTPTQVYVTAGEMVVLQCPHYKRYNSKDARPTWTNHTTQEMDLTNVSSAEQRQMGVLLYERSLVILNASVNHQGNYSCFLGNVSRRFWFMLMVHTTQARQYKLSCIAQKSCTLHCPDKNIPATNTPNITSSGIRWHKVGDSLPTSSYFSSVEENNHGVYTCTRSYRYLGQIHHMTFTVVLDVQEKEKSWKSAAIISPRMNDTFYVELGSAVVIDCKAVVYSEYDEVFWLIGESVVDDDSSLPVFYNYSCERNPQEVKVTASLIIKNVSETDLFENYTCKLDSDSQPPSFVTITLTKKTPSCPPSYLSLALSIVCIVLVMGLTVVIYVKFKIDIALFLRDTLGCYSSTSSDGKVHDAFLMCYKSDAQAGLNELDLKSLKSVLEERFGYSLCLFDRDILPGKDVANAVLDCIEQSRSVVLVPTSSDLCLESGLLSAIHAALVERQTHLVFIKTEATEVSRSGPVPEVLQLLAEAGDCVTWKGSSSMSPSSSFWKKLRYDLPAPHNAKDIRLLS